MVNALAPAPPPLDLDNIQADIIVGLPKNVEVYAFLRIIDVPKFRADLTNLAPLITSANNVLADQKRANEGQSQVQTSGSGENPNFPSLGTNISFSHTGLDKIGFAASDLIDEAFIKGQKADAHNLGDFFDPANPSDPDWAPAFKQEIDVLVDVTASSWEHLAGRWSDIEGILGVGTKHASVCIVIKVKGEVRSAKEKGHEHFGLHNHLSQPAIAGFGSAPEPGQRALPAGVFLLGHPKLPIVQVPHMPSRKPDAVLPSWATDGSFLVFRSLVQFEPELDHFLTKYATTLPSISRGHEFLGARIATRWKHEVPIVERPMTADPHSIIRRGILFGPEVTQEEMDAQQTAHKRGLAFVCYQSRIDDGFHYLQHGWMNNPAYVGKHPRDIPRGSVPFADLIRNEKHRLDGTSPFAESPRMKIVGQAPSDFVIPDGGGYFFVPSISTLRDKFAVGPALEVDKADIRSE